MIARSSVTLLVVALCAAPARLAGQAVDRIGASDLNAALTQSMSSGSRGVLFRASDDRNAQFILNRRTEPSHVELHCRWDDLLIVRSGVGVLSHGRKLKGLERYGSAEWRATAIVTPREVNLTPGDVVRVPAGEGHTITQLGAAPLVYLVVKVRSVEATPCGSLPHRGQ